MSNIELESREMSGERSSKSHVNSTTGTGLSLLLSDWQKSQLEGLSEPGTACLLKSWMALASENRTEGTYYIFLNSH